MKQVSLKNLQIDNVTLYLVYRKSYSDTQCRKEIAIGTLDYDFRVADYMKRQQLKLNFKSYIYRNVKGENVEIVSIDHPVTIYPKQCEFFVLTNPLEYSELI